MSLLHKRSCKKLLSLTFVVLLLVNVLWFGTIITSVSAQPLTLKWSRSLGELAKTNLAPLAADLVGDDRLEVVVVGGEQLWSDEGTITVLDGTTGNIIWQEIYPGVGMHSGFDIIDLNKDDIPEIIVGAQNALVVHGNNGSIYWRNTFARTDGCYSTVCDIDGDGYPEVFVNSDLGNRWGYDYITMLSYDGKILRQTWCWHPCYGGLSIADTNFDGRFELYEGDRDNEYSSGGDLYFGGGMGPRALDAHTLEPLWNDPDILCSSHTPMLADVDKDGILDVIVAWQSRGLAVLNSADGSVVTTGGKIRKSDRLGLSSHSQPTVYDIDGDGNLEIITCYDSPIYIWDLYDWELDAVIDEDCPEPPKLGDVTGDGEMEIIVASYGSINIYDNDYNLVQTITGVTGARPFTLVQDVDGDDLNELVVTSGFGYVYCYDTPAPAPTPRARSNLQFYSEYNLGAAVNVPPPAPTRPYLSDERPFDWTFNQTLNPTLSVHAADSQGNLMDITFRTNASGTWQDINSFLDVPNGVYNATPTNMDEKGTLYYWSVNATDTVTGEWTYNVYRFITYSNPPTHEDPILVSGGGPKDNLVCYNQTTVYPDGDEVTNIYNWYVDDNSLTNLLLPFDTRPYPSETVIFADGFEENFDKWDENGDTDWDRTAGQSHSGSYSAHAGSGDTYLTSDDMDMSGAEWFGVSFWYRDDDIDNNDDVFLQFWNGTEYLGMFELGVTVPEDEWQHYTIWWRTKFWCGIPDFHIRFDAGGLDSGENVWIDDVSIILAGESVTASTKDYSGYENHGTVTGATWTSEGVMGGALSFDGDDRIKVVENAASLGGDGSWTEISVEFWVKATTDTSTRRLIWNHDASDTSILGYEVDFRHRSSRDRNEVTWRIYTPSDSYSMVYYIYGGLLDWHHVMCTYKSGTGLKIYVDGTERESSSAIGNIQATGDGILEIGYDRGSSDFSGVLDEVRIYPRALSPFQVSMRYNETRDGVSSNSTVVWYETEIGDEWKCQVTPNDGLVDGESKFSNAETIHEGGNTPPEAANLTVTPLSPGTSDTLTGSYDFFDADGDPEYGTEITWYKDGVLQPDLNGSSTVSSSFTAKGEEWNFTVRPKDGVEFGETQTVSLTILNTPPSFTGMYVTPDPAFNTSMLTANPYGWVDPDDDLEGYVYQWQILDGGTWQTLIGETSQTLSPDNFERGDTVRVNCTAFDGENNGTSSVDVVWIVNSDPPTHDDPMLVSSLGTNMADEELICYNQTTVDPDGDEVTNIYHWILDGDSLTNLLMPFDTNSSATAADYSGYGNDGTVYCATWTSDGIVGGAYEFDGDDVIVIPDDQSLGGNDTWTEISIESWIRPSAPVSGTRIIARKVGSASTGSYMIGFQTSGDPPNTLFWGITTADDGDWHDISDSPDWDPEADGLVLEVGEWYHVFCTYQSGLGLTIYVNGIERFNMPLDGNITNEGYDEELFLGYDGGGPSYRYLSGALDDVRIYPIALTSAQIFQRYIETKDGVSSSSTIVPQETTVGEVWTCEVIPNDSWQDGTAKTSNPLTVQTVTGNSRPRIDTYTPSDMTPEIDEETSLDFNHTSSDPDGDPLSYSWLLDDGEQSTTQNWTYSPSGGDAGTHNVTLVISDGELTDSQQWNVTVVSVGSDVSYLVVRGLDNLVYYRVYNSSSDSWGDWDFVPTGLTSDSPATAVYSGRLYAVIRGLDGQSLWFGWINLTDNSFSNWTSISGQTPSAPTLVSYDDKLVLVVRGLNNRIYYRFYDCVLDDWGDWIMLPGATCDSPAAAVLDDQLHMVVRGFSSTSVYANYSLWYGSMDLTTEIFSGWTRTPGLTPSAPTLATSQPPNRLYLLVRGLNDRIYYNIWNGTNWEGLTVLTGATSDCPGATIVSEELHIVVRGISTTTLWHYYINLSTDDHSGWTQISGLTPSAPTLAN